MKDDWKPKYTAMFTPESLSGNGEYDPLVVVRLVKLARVLARRIDEEE